MSETSPEPIGLERRIRRIEEIAAALENERLELQDALSLFEEGVAHVREAETLLAEGELRIERLLDDGRGGVTKGPVHEERR